MPSESYDFIIVGAGTAGCVLANRLSENAATTVCLVEAGERDRYPLIQVPAAVPFTILNPKLGWGYETIPQHHCNDRRVTLPRGRVLGGSSSTNGMVYFRGHPGDYDDWAASGARGWSYAEVLPYFLRSEHNPAFADSPYHHVGGPMAVSNIPKVNPLVTSFLESTQALNLPQCCDFNGPDPDGFGPRQGTIRNGRRESGVTAFLRPAERRANLKIVVGALAHRVLLQQRRATGLQIEHRGAQVTLSARLEVIVCAGSYGSPALLMRSGIGPAESLKAAGVEPVFELAGVGQGLRDHPSAEIQMATRDATSYGVSWQKTFDNALTLLRYLAFRSGPLASNLFEGHGFFKSDPAIATPRPADHHDARAAERAPACAAARTRLRHYRRAGAPRQFGEHTHRFSGPARQAPDRPESAVRLPGRCAHPHRAAPGSTDPERQGLRTLSRYRAQTRRRRGNG